MEPLARGRLSQDAVRLASILGLSIVARTLFITLMPAEAVSYDLVHWGHAAQAFAAGTNPYADPQMEWNWPPVWIPLLHVLFHLTAGIHLSFLTVIRIFIIAVESGLTVLLYALLRRYWAPVNATRLLVWGVSLNPICILLMGQHANFDVLPALGALLALAMALSFQRSGDPVYWLAGSLFLGLAAATKVVPFVLAPLLAFGAHRLSRRTLALGLALFAGPTLYGMMLLYAVSPHLVVLQILRYRSSPGWFGVTGLLGLFGLDRFYDSYSTAFTLTYLAGLALLTLLCWRTRTATNDVLVLLAAVLMSIIPLLGPGYAPQYFYWYFPFYLLAFDAYGRPWRWLMLVALAVAVVTYLEEYAFLPSHGQFLVYLHPTPRVLRWSAFLRSSRIQTLARLPLFGVALVTLALAARQLRQAFAQSHNASRHARALTAPSNRRA